VFPAWVLTDSTCPFCEYGTGYLGIVVVLEQASFSNGVLSVLWSGSGSPPCEQSPERSHQGCQGQAVLACCVLCALSAAWLRPRASLHTMKWLCDELLCDLTSSDLITCCMLRMSPYALATVADHCECPAVYRGVRKLCKLCKLGTHV
jgi:hypothetical protein